MRGKFIAVSFFIYFLEDLKSGTVLMACKSRKIMDVVRDNPFKYWGECLSSEYEGQTKWSVTGGQTDWPSIVCSIVRCAKLHAKVILSIMNFFYQFLSCLLCDFPRRPRKGSRWRPKHSEIWSTFCNDGIIITNPDLKHLEYFNNDLKFSTGLLLCFYVCNIIPRKGNHCMSLIICFGQNSWLSWWSIFFFFDISLSLALTPPECSCVQVKCPLLN